MSTVELFLRFLVSMAVVVGLIGIAGRTLRRRALRMGGLLGRREMPVSVLHRQTLGKGMSVVVVRAAGRGLLLGVTPSSIRVLSEVDLGYFGLYGSEESESEATEAAGGMAVGGTASGGMAVGGTASGGMAVGGAAAPGASLASILPFGLLRERELERSIRFPGAAKAQARGSGLARRQLAGPQGAARSAAGAGNGSRWTAPAMRGASPVFAWMAKLEQIRERTVRRG